MTDPEWVKVAELTDVSRRGKKLVCVGAERVALFVDDGEVFAFQDSCVHKDRSLARGTLLDGRIICPGHQWAFDLRTGQAEDRPERQPGYEAKVEDGHVWVLARRRVPATSEPSPARTAHLVQE
ncbi:Rieske (2Fe-2S) protein [Streptomyces sp. NPDC000880]